MWMFGRTFFEGPALDELRSEAEELQAKLDALRAAEYREQLRQSVAATAAKSGKGGGNPSARSASPGPGVDGSQSQRSETAGAEHYRLDDEPAHTACDLIDMYEFTRFVPGHDDSSAARPEGEGAASAMELDRDAVLQAQVRAQAAVMDEVANELQTMRGQVQELVSQLKVRRPLDCDLDSWVAKLSGSLVEKVSTLGTSIKGAEDKLEASSAEATAALANLPPAAVTAVKVDEEAPLLMQLPANLQEALPPPGKPEGDAKDSGLTAEDGKENVPPVAEAPPAGTKAQMEPAMPTVPDAAVAPAVAEAGAQEALPPGAAATTVVLDASGSTGGPPAVDEEQLMELARITEELTDALESSRDAEDAARREILMFSTRLNEEYYARVALERELYAYKQSMEQEATAWRSRFAEQERDLHFERQRTKCSEERAARVEFEYGLERALANKGRKLMSRHLDA